MNEETFWSSTKEDRNCLIWTKGGSGGYGYALFNGEVWLTHRLAWFLRKGVRPKGRPNWVLHHKCENKSCINVDHMREITRLQHAHIHFGSKTHCPQGHEYSDSNTILYRGRRSCRQCNNERINERNRLKREARGPLPQREPKTHCVHNHPFNEENTRWYRDRRFCIACERERTDRRRQERETSRWRVD